MTDNKKPSNSNDEEWNFEKGLDKTLTNKKIIAEAKPQPKPVKDKALALDDSAVPRTRTRSAMAMEMYGNKEEELKDEFTFAPFEKRGIALAIDLAFDYGIWKFVILSAPILRKIIQFFLDKYKLQFIFPEETVLKLIMTATCCLSIFF